MVQDREIADHHRNAAFFERANQFVAMAMDAIERGELSPAQAGCVQALDFRGDPTRFLLRRREFDDADFFAVGLVRQQLLLGNERRVVDEAGDLRGRAQNARRGAVIIHQRLDKARRAGGIAARNAGKALEEDREASKRGAAEPVDGLRAIAYGDHVAMVRRQFPEQLDLRDVGVLEFVHQNVSVARAQRVAKSEIALE